jgi:hypothetical protein
LATASVACQQFVFLSFSVFGGVDWRLFTIKWDVYRRTLRCQEKAIRLEGGVSAVFVSRAVKFGHLKWSGKLSDESRYY